MFFKSLPFQLLLCLLFALFFGDLLPEHVIRLAYTLSCQFKEILLALLPFVIFSYISTAILSLDKGAPKLIFGIISLVVIINAISVCVSYGSAYVFLPYLTNNNESLCQLAQHAAVQHYKVYSFPKFIDADVMLLIALGFGLIFNIFRIPTVTEYSLKFQRFITNLLTKILIPLLPVYILGFALKMKYEGDLVTICQSYRHVFVGILMLMITYITLMYSMTQGFRLKATIQAIRNMIPAGITGFSTMSSAATLPITLAATLKNVPNSSFAQLVIPTTVNIHMMADAVCLPFLTFGIMAMFNQTMPSFEQFLIFIPAFCLAKFSLASIPGGTIMVMLPLLQTYFNINQDVSSLLTTLYVLQDPLFTSGNVMGNGAFAIGSYKLLMKSHKTDSFRGK